VVGIKMARQLLGFTQKHFKSGTFLGTQELPGYCPTERVLIRMAKTMDIPVSTFFLLEEGDKRIYNVDLKFIPCRFGKGIKEFQRLAGLLDVEMATLLSINTQTYINRCGTTMSSKTLYSAAEIFKVPASHIVILGEDGHFLADAVRNSFLKRK